MSEEVLKKVDQFISDMAAKFPKYKWTRMAGPKNIRIVRTDIDNEMSRSVYCFVRKSDGAILKAAGWNAPAKGVRGSIMDYDIKKFDWSAGCLYR